MTHWLRLVLDATDLLCFGTLGNQGAHHRHCDCDRCRRERGMRGPVGPTADRGR